MKRSRKSSQVLGLRSDFDRFQEPSEMPDISPRGVRIAVRNLWKVFGPDEHTILGEDWVRTATKAEVQKRTGNVIAVRDVSFDVRVGEVFVVMGLSGSGKSTLLRCLIRLIEPTQGMIEIDGENVLEYDQKQLIELRRSKTAMIFQHYGLFPHLNVIDNTAYGLKVQGIDKESRYRKAREVLEQVGLKGWEHAYPNELSGGMQQRVGIARALALDPEILLMDEPFSGLDPLIRRQMQDELIELQQRLQKTIVFITHDLLEALRLGDRIAIMGDGAISQQGTPEQIVMAPADDYVRDFVKDVSKTRVMTVKSIMYEPQAIFDASQSLQAAITLMRANETSTAFVVNADRLLRGLITLDRAEKAAASGVWVLREASLSKCAQVSHRTRVQDIIPLVAESEHPIAVVDDQGHLLGVVDRPMLLKALCEDYAPQAH